MDDRAPVIYLLHGEDEFAISQHVAKLRENLGDAALVEANTTYLDGNNFQIENLAQHVLPMPFLAKRRMVILTDPLARLDPPKKEGEQESEAERERLRELRVNFLSQLERVPDTTALVLVEHRLLSKEKDGKKTKTPAWLWKWIREHQEIVWVEAFPHPRDLSDWITMQARQYGGQFSHQAAKRLSELVGDDTRLADQEIRKLLDFVDYRRQVEAEDVERLSVDSSQANIFKMVDALGSGNAQIAASTLQHLLEQEDPGYIYAMVVRQFRYLLLIREILEQGGGVNNVIEELRFLQSKKKPVPFWMANKLLSQARNFTLPALEGIYQRLLKIDEQVKSSQIPLDLALEMFVTELTTRRHAHSRSISR